MLELVDIFAFIDVVPRGLTCLFFIFALELFFFFPTANKKSVLGYDEVVA